ncbi:bifunctional hydroxymethylpyrimidine kinase/phosphomethylpyrimidine kinase [Bacteroides clarus]|uniref:bifunctional hydroxymethylpyrimidine kinase/phosphomethylpyrimidine kinase n=1 Tax=Bacteroides clarus TaxID=626929 RepID=UPI002665909B|nr:bifunctional hydroxymethylpyrimidine kinase/phosphomethylpyrimidine kinase [Bacteroides clarus]
MSTIPVILTIAGSDCSGGAGIQADIKTISALKGYAASVITAVTAQNTTGVQAVYPIPPDIVRAQIISVTDDLQPAAIKIGMVHNAAIVHIIAECLQKYRSRFVVYDPVMVSTSGRKLMTEDTVCAIQNELFPLCSLITPNLSEASLLLSNPVTDLEEMKHAARELANRYHCAVLVKGGHLSGGTMCDVLYNNGSVSLFEQQKIESCNLHGTGCTLSSAIATFAARNNGLEKAIRQAKAYIGKAIYYGKDLHIGHGNGPLCHFFSGE